MKTFQSESRFILFIKWSLDWWADVWPISKAEFKVYERCLKLLDHVSYKRSSWQHQVLGGCSAENHCSPQLSNGKRKRKSSISKSRPLKWWDRIAAWGERSWVREPHIPNLMKKIHTKEMTRNIKFFHEQCSVHPQLSRHWVPTAPTVDNGLITDPGHFSEFHWEGFQNRLQRSWMIILQENQPWEARNRCRPHSSRRSPC